MNIIETLRELGFTEGEIRVYLALVKLGSTTIGPIINEAQVSNSKIYILLEKLTKKGIVSYIFKGKTKYFQASSPNYLYDILELEQNKINKLKDSLKEVIDFIEKNSDKSKEESKIYKGYNGMKSAWFEAIKSIPLCGKYYFFSKGYGKDSYLKSFFRNLSSELHEKKIQILGLANIDEKKEYNLFYKKLGYNMKYTSLNWPADITIAGDFLLIFIWDKDIPIVYSIQSRILVESYKIFFQNLYNSKK